MHTYMFAVCTNSISVLVMKQAVTSSQSMHQSFQFKQSIRQHLGLWPSAVVQKQHISDQ